MLVEHFPSASVNSRGETILITEKPQSQNLIWRKSSWRWEKTRSAQQTEYIKNAMNIGESVNF